MVSGGGVGGLGTEFGEFDAEGWPLWDILEGGVVLVGLPSSLLIMSVAGRFE